MSPNWYSTLADVVLVSHALFLAFVIGGLLAIVLGGLLGWGWVRNPYFRFIHLGLIFFVIGEAWVGYECPLTTWEDDLRDAAGQFGYGEGGFIAYYVRGIIFFQAEPWVFTLAYTSFGLLVAATLIWVPVRLRRRSPSVPSS